MKCITTNDMIWVWSGILLFTLKKKKGHTIGNHIIHPTERHVANLTDKDWEILVSVGDVSMLERPKDQKSRYFYP